MTSGYDIFLSQYARRKADGSFETEEEAATRVAEALSESLPPDDSVSWGEWWEGKREEADEMTYSSFLPGPDILYPGPQTHCGWCGRDLVDGKCSDEEMHRRELPY